MIRIRETRSDSFFSWIQRSHSRVRASFRFSPCFKPGMPFPGLTHTVMDLISGAFFLWTGTFHRWSVKRQDHSSSPLDWPVLLKAGLTFLFLSRIIPIHSIRRLLSVSDCPHPQGSS